MVIRMRANRSKRGKRRSHSALVSGRTATCECGALRLPHRACRKCGKYNGRVVKDVVAETKRAATRAKRHQKALQASGVTKSSDSEKTDK
jgi:large subunit ribosomal protein L32